MLAYIKIFFGRGVQDQSWYLILINDQNDILAASLNLEKKIWMIIGIAILMTVLVAHFLGQLISHPIIKLNNAAREITEGKFFKTIEHYSKDEIGELTSTFNIMTEKLRQTMDYLSKSEEQFRTIFEQSPMGMVIAFPDIRR